MNEHHVNHVADVCSADCRPAPEWLRARRDRAHAEIDNLRARLAAVEAVVHEYGAYGQVPEARIRAALRETP